MGQKCRWTGRVYRGDRGLNMWCGILDDTMVVVWYWSSTRGNVMPMGVLSWHRKKRIGVNNKMNEAATLAFRVLVLCMQTHCGRTNEWRRVCHHYDKMSALKKGLLSKMFWVYFERMLLLKFHLLNGFNTTLTRLHLKELLMKHRTLVLSREDLYRIWNKRTDPSLQNLLLILSCETYVHKEELWCLYVSYCIAPFDTFFFFLAHKYLM